MNLIKYLIEGLGALIVTVVKNEEILAHARLHNEMMDLYLQLLVGFYDFEDAGKPLPDLAKFVREFEDKHREVVNGLQSLKFK